MKLREVLIAGFLSQTFTYQNFVNLLRNRSLFDPNDITIREVVHFSQIKGKNIDQFSSDSWKDQLMLAEKQKINFLTVVDQEYPDRLLESYSPPIVLTFQGNLDLLKTRCLAIVGGRIYPEHAPEIINNFSQGIIKSGITTVSGLAKGVDSIAHQSTIVHGGATIAVIGTGLRQYYPKENKNLQDEIAEKHLLISEYPPEIGAKRFHFPQRNRIIAGVSHGVLVANAKNHSGSLITGNLALQNNRDVFAFPGELNDPLYEGSNKLIQAGAKLVLQSEDVSEDLQYYW